MIVIFDLDGTLVDTFPVIRKTFIEVITRFLPEIKYDEEMIASFFGPTLEESFLKLTDNNIEKAHELINEYRKINKAYYESEIKLFPDAIFALEKLKKHKLVVLSNRIQELVETGIKITGIDKYFDLVCGLEKLPKPKPNPDGIYKVLDNFDNDLAVFIGDAITDIECARRAGIVSIGVTWALTSRKEFKDAKADYIVDSFIELVNLLEEINV